VIATDHAERALACAQDNVQRLGVAAQVQLCNVDLFPPGHADLIVCNPPWLPVRATTSLEQAVYDPDSRMLRGFFAGLAAHLRPGGEGWLILSDLAEHLGLRSQAVQLVQAMAFFQVNEGGTARPSPAAAHAAPRPSAKPIAAPAINSGKVEKKLANSPKTTAPTAPKKAAPTAPTPAPATALTAPKPKPAAKAPSKPATSNEDDWETF